jgi:hypothetical protein
MLVNIVRLAMRFANTHTYIKLNHYSIYRMTIECSLVMLLFCLTMGISSADYDIPLRIYFYWQFIIIAVILSASARVLTDARARHIIL